MIGAPLRAVIFDMDGVLIDTEPVWRRVEAEIFGELGLQLTEEQCRQTMGLRVDEVVARWYGVHPWAGPSPAAVAERIVEAVIDHVRRHGAAMPGALAAMRLVRRQGLLCAVASSSEPRLIEVVLTCLQLDQQVDVVRSAQNEAAGKPAPDVYLSTAAALGVVPSSCLAIEDSVHGVGAALAAGMRCIAIPEADSRHDFRFAAATMRLASLEELTEEVLRGVADRYFS